VAGSKLRSQVWPSTNIAASNLRDPDVPQLLAPLSQGFYDRVADRMLASAAPTGCVPYLSVFSENIGGGVLFLLSLSNCCLRRVF
jgi:hypothetical protein